MARKAEHHRAQHSAAAYSGNDAFIEAEKERFNSRKMALLTQIKKFRILDQYQVDGPNSRNPTTRGQNLDSERANINLENDFAGGNDDALLVHAFRLLRTANFSYREDDRVEIPVYPFDDPR